MKEVLDENHMTAPTTERCQICDHEQSGVKYGCWTCERCHQKYEYTLLVLKAEQLAMLRAMHEGNDTSVYVFESADGAPLVAVSYDEQRALAVGRRQGLRVRKQDYVFARAKTVADFSGRGITGE